MPDSRRDLSTAPQVSHYARGPIHVDRGVTNQPLTKFDCSRHEALTRMHTRQPVSLTPREREVVRGVINGRTNREIARELNLGEQSVKNVLSTVYQKCHVRSRLELALYAVRHHLGDG